MKATRRQKLLANGDLEIMPVVQGDNGYYTCEARNTIGSTFHTARVVVKGTQSLQVYLRPNNKIERLVFINTMNYCSHLFS